MRKPIIAITPKTGNGGDEDSKFCYVFPNFINCVSACGGIPIQLSSLEGSFQVADLDELLERVDGVLFSGGPDIHPGLYGEELLDCCGALAPERDALEIPLMQKAIAMDKPVFGICRGFQVLNVVTGGTMHAGPELLTLEQLGMYSAKYERGEIDEAKLNWAKQNACPSCGACSFIGTASTMQIMAEALGLALPGSALLPATSPDLVEYARRAGYQAVVLAKQGLRPSDVVTMDSFENAIMVHAAISGSTNALLHLPAIAHEFGISIDGDTFDRLHRGAKYLLDIRPAGRWPAEFFYYAGGVPAIMDEIRDVLHLDAMTITGKTLGENLDELKAHYTRGGLGDVKVKKFLNNVIQSELSPIRERRKMWENRLPDVLEILKVGSEKAEKTAAATLHDVREAMKINYFDNTADLLGS